MHAVAIDTLISTIYEAAIDNAVWHRVADGLAAEFPWAGVSFVFRRPAMAHDLYVHTGYAPGAIEDFSANYAALCPWNDLQRDCKVGIPFATEDTLSQSAISGSRFFKDWLIPNGYGAGFGLKISDIPDCHASLVLHGTLADARTHRGDVLNLLTQLGPHLRRSVDVSRLLGATKDEGWRAAIVRAADAMAILDGNAHVLLTNDAMERLMTAGHCVVTAARKLRLHKPEDTARMSAVLFEAAQGRRSTPWPHVIAFDVIGRTGPNVLEIEPLYRAGARVADARGNFLRSAPSLTAFIVTLRLRSHLGSPSVEQIRTGLGLTPKQAEAVWSLVNGESIEKQAQKRGLSVEGVRWHFKNIYQRTGCTTQAELVRLVISLFSPAKT